MSLKLISAVISVFIIAWNWFIVSTEIQLSILKISNFPIAEGKEFKINLTADNNGPRLSDSIQDTMVIEISNTTGYQMEKAIYDYGFKDAIDQEYRGLYMRIPEWQKQQRALSLSEMSSSNDEGGYGVEYRRVEVMSVVIVFSRLANNHVITIYQISTDSRPRRKQVLSNLGQAIMIHRSSIELLIAPKLDLFIKTLDGRRGELMLDHPGIVTCRAYDGYPVQKPFWVNLKEFTVVPDDQGKGDSFNNATNTLQVQISVTVADHLKELRCQAGSTKALVKIIVLHHPSQISLEPDVGNFVQNGTSIVCSAVDGYPSPDIAWHFVAGPPNANRFFNVSQDGKTLHLNSDAVLGSQWIFNCSASNRLPNSYEVYNLTVSFTIDLTYQIVIGVAMMVAIIVFCFVVVFIVYIVRRSCKTGGGGTSSSSRTSRRNGAPGKVPADKKSLEPEQLTLLPPGGQINHLDMTNVGSGLPPPPPEYQLLLENDINHVVPMEPQMGNDSYAEVTYAELNTSYLPMKEKKTAQPTNVKDDQVIYSQIIGTMATPQECVKRGYMDVDNSCCDNSKGVYKAPLQAPTSTAAAAQLNDDQVIYSQIIGTMTTGTQDCV